MSNPRWFDVRPEERRNTFAAFAALLAITTGHTLLETARDAFFLSKLPVAQLPWMYLVVVVLALGLNQIRRADGKRGITLVLVIAAVVTASFRMLVGHHQYTPPVVLYALYAWSGLISSWIVAQFWTLLGRVHTARQAKRLYGFIGAGAVLGGVVGAFAARAALAFVPTREVLVASGGFFLLAALPVLAVREPRVSSAEASSGNADGVKAPRMTTGVKLLQQNPFASRILLIVFVATIALTLGDFLFKAQVAKHYPHTHDLAAFLSIFYAVVNTISLLAQLFVGPWIFRTVGVQRALFLFPSLLLGAASAVLATGGFIAAVVLKALDGTLRYSVHRTSMELLLVPVPDGTRERVKPIIELVGTRGGQAMASFAILLLVVVDTHNAATVGAFVVALTVLWLALVVTSRGYYLDVFRETLRTGGLSGKVELPELDLGALEMLFAGLNSSRDIEVLASLELLAEQHRERLIPALILYHPSRDVVLRALELFTQRGRADFVSIADRLNGHPDREVAAAALRARSAVAPDRDLLERRLDDECPQVAVTAVVALLARGWIALEDADRRIKDAIATRSWQTASELARAVRDISFDDTLDRDRQREITERFDELLIRLAREAGSFRDLSCDAGPTPDEPLGLARPLTPSTIFAPVEIQVDVRVRLEVARAMAVRKSPAFLPVLVGMLNRHELRATARAAIAQIPDALEFVDEVLRQRDFARDVRVHLPRTMVLFDPDRAARKLIGHLLTEKDGAVRFKVLRALVKLRHENPGLFLEEDVLRRAAEANLDHVAELRRWGFGLGAADERPADDESQPSSVPSIPKPPESVNIGSDPLRAGHHLLLDLVRDKEMHATQRLFMLLQLLYNEDFEDIERGLRSKNPKTRANSLELVENIVRPPLRDRILEVVDGPRPEQPMAYEDVIAEILVHGGSTMRTLAEYRALELGIDAAAITGTRPSQPPTFESIGRRLVDRARTLFTPPDEVRPGMTGATRAPA